MNNRFVYDMDFVRNQSDKKLFEVVSLFAGGGGSSTGYRLAGGKVLAINEFIPAAQEVYAKNYPDTHIFKEDVRELTSEMILKQIGKEVGELDILDGSPPCSAFSLAGKREKGWGTSKRYSDSEQRVDDLFFEFARILKGIQPKVFIAENVKGLTIGASKNLLGSDQLDMFGAHEDTIYHTLVNCGYKVRFKVLNASDYFVPQSRERIIFIGVRNDFDIQITYPERSPINVSVHDAIHDLIPDDFRKLSPTLERIFDDLKLGEPTLSYGVRTGDKMGGTQRSKCFKDIPSRTITTTPEVFHYTQRRTLAINELKRICGFPDDYYTGKGFNKSWERLGRAVPPLMMAAVAKHVTKTILNKI
jgi:DNA (cytosine-5)-methyltransferase 1